MRITFLLFLLSPYVAFGQSRIDLVGIYTGENRYIQNPYANDQLTMFCVDSIQVNNRLIGADLNQYTIEVSLINLGLVLGDSVRISIFHKNTCIPKLLVSMSRPKVSKVRFDSIQITNAGMLTWNTHNDTMGIRPDFRIQQLFFNRWVEVATIQQRWKETNSYRVTLPLISGENTFRVNCFLNSSDTVTVVSNKLPIVFTVDSISKNITFDEKVFFELHSAKGITRLKGFEQVVDFSFLKKGIYVLWYNNEKVTCKVEKKKLFLMR